MRHTLLLLALLWVNALAAQTAEKRVALVVGNARYTTSPLANPANDARDVAAALQKAGFSVTLKYDQAYDALNNLLTAFAGSIKDPGTVALFYYAGHGVQYGGQSYLVPIGADNLAEESEIEWRCVPLERVTAKMQDASNRLNVIVLDACRSFPVARGTRKLQNGLAASGVTVPELLIAYATAPGGVADDRSEGANGLFTASLLRHISTPGYDLHKVFLETRKDVKQRTNGKQVPGVTDNVTIDFYFFPPPPLPDKPQEPVLSEKTSPQPSNLPAANPPATVQPPSAHAPEMVEVKGGKFRMGSETDDTDAGDAERPAHPVTVPDFEMSKYEVTNAEFCRFLNEIASKITLNADGEVTLDGKVVYDLYCSGQKVGGCAGFTEQIEYDNGTAAGGEFSVKRGWERHPVVMVTWDGAKAYAAWLSKKTSLAYRLPSEAEWEYAARGGQQSRAIAQGGVDYKYAGSDDPKEVAWYDQNSEKKSHPVGGKKANQLSLHDLSGNVWEWCEDCWHATYVGHPRDGSAWVESKCSSRVVRGGSWFFNSRNVRAAVRGRVAPGLTYNSFGFRLARTK